MTTTEKDQKNLMAGAWSEYICMNKQAEQVFNEVEMPLGVSYKPVAFSSQLVAGMNFRFFCNSKVIYPHSLNSAAIVSIFKPLEGKAVLTSITPIHL